MKFSMQKNRRRFARRPWQMVLELLEARTLLTAPVIAPVSDQVVEIMGVQQLVGVHTPFNLPVTASDVTDGDSINLSAALTGGGFLPAWLTFTPGPVGSGTGTFTGTPVDADVGPLDVTITALDSAAEMSTFDFTIAVPLNHTPQFIKGADQTPAFSGNPRIVSVPWGTGIYEGPPEEYAQTLTFLVTTDNDAMFDVLPQISINELLAHPLTGTLTYTLKAGATGTANVLVRLKDNGGNALGGVDTSDSQLLVIAVTNSTDAALTLDNPIPNQTVGVHTPFSLSTAGVFSVTDMDLVLLSATLSNGNDLPAWLTFTPGAASATPTADFTGTPLDADIGSIDITLTATDPSGNVATNTFTINVLSNHTPQFTKGPDQLIDEDDSAQSVPNWVIDFLTGPPEEAGQTVTYLVTTDNDALFSVLPTISPDGDLTYTVAPDANGSATVSVRIKDNGGNASGGVDTSDPQTFTITVNPINDAPSFTKGPDVTVLEDSGNQTVANWATNISAGPNEATQSVTFTVTNSNNALFSVQPTIAADGTLTFTPAADASGSAIITVTAMDDGGVLPSGFDTSAPQTFNLNITAVNDAPSITLAGNPAAISEDEGLQTVPNFVATVDVGANEVGQVITNYTVTQTASSGGLTFSTAPSIDPITRTLTYQAAANSSGTATFSVTATDDGGTDNGGVETSASQTFIISVGAVNDPPSFVLNGNPAASGEDAGFQVVAAFAKNISAGAPDEVGQILTFTLTPGGTTGGLTFFAAPTIDPITGNLTYQAAASSNGTATFSVTLSDNGGGTNISAAQLFTITVNAVNDAPTFVLAGNPATVLEDAGAQTVATFATGITTGAANESAQTLTFNIIQTASTGGLTFLTTPTIDLITGDLTYRAAADANGSATFTVTLMDNGGTANGGSDTSATLSFTITVTAVNDVPSFTIVGDPPTVVEDAGLQSVANFATNISAGPANESTQVLTFTLMMTASTDGLTFAVTPTIDPLTGTLTYQSTANLSGTATFSVILTDDGGTLFSGDNASDAQFFTITVLNINDAPTFSKGPNWEDLIVGVNDGPQEILNWVANISPGPADEMSQVVDFIVTTTNPGLFSVLPFISPTGTLTFTPLSGFGGTATISVKLHDDGGTENGGVDTSVAQTFTITTVVQDLTYTATGKTQLKATVVNGLLKVQIGGVPYSSYQTAHIETLTLNGGSSIDVVNLSGLSPILYPKLKNIVINGGAGNDAVTMTAVSSTAFPMLLTMTINGDAGNDVVNFAGLPASLFPTLTNFVINGGTGNDVIYASESSETISGGDGNDSIRGAGGSDNITGGIGTDTIQGGIGDDTIDGGAGNDAISGQGGADSLIGGDGNDTLIGGAGNDVLKGGKGNDLLIGGAGVDVIDGELGTDTALGGKGGPARGGNSASDVGDSITVEIINEAFSKLFAFE